MGGSQKETHRTGSPGAHLGRDTEHEGHENGISGCDLIEGDCLQLGKQLTLSLRPRPGGVSEREISRMHYVLFMDETGDHNLRNIDHNFPIFCLVGCIFERRYYHQVVRPKVDAFKKRFWGTTDVILHSRDIRKHQGPFIFLGDARRREEFYVALNELMRTLDFTILAMVLLKWAHLNKYGNRARHPYHLSLEFIIERYSLLMRRRNASATGYILAESRGKQPDRLLKAEYQRLQSSGTFYQQDLSNITGLWMEKKAKNIAGLQIADLVAYPVAAKVLRPQVEQKAFDVIYDKIDAAPYSCLLYTSPSPRD